MPTYVYQTTDPGTPVRHYEIDQRMSADALTVHPETGEAIRRVISGGLGFINASNQSTDNGLCGMTGEPKPAGGCGSGMCGHSHH